MAAVICVTGVLMFFIGAATGTVTGYRGADGRYYSYPGSTGSRDWMITPGLLMAVGGGIGYGAISLLTDEKKK